MGGDRRVFVLTFLSISGGPSALSGPFFLPPEPTHSSDERPRHPGHLSRVSGGRDKCLGPSRRSVEPVSSPELTVFDGAALARSRFTSSGSPESVDRRRLV